MNLLSGTPLASYYKLIVALLAVIIVIAFLTLFLGTRLGLAIRATGNNPIMVKSSSINTVFTTIVGLCVANAFTGLSGCLLAQYQKSVNIDIGSGMVTIALASLLIGATILGRGKIVHVPLVSYSVPLFSALSTPSHFVSIFRHSCSSWYLLSLSSLHCLSHI